MDKNQARVSLSFSRLAGLGLYAVLVAFFYHRYVPLVAGFQAALAPVLAVTAALTAVRKAWGILWFVFVLPLINILPYLFGMDSSHPHAPTALALFLAFFLGWGWNAVFRRAGVRGDLSLYRPMLILGLVAFASALITSLRYMNFFPFKAGQVHELIVNVYGVRTGGAVMSSTLNFLNYASGFLFFVIVVDTVRSREMVKKILFSLSMSTGVVLVFAGLQRYVSLDLGNTAFFVNINRLNSTFKDPNSFGLFLSVFIPVLAGMLLSAKKSLKPYLGTLLLLSFFVFPWAGSRSGMLALVIALLLFCNLVLLKKGMAATKRWGFTAAVLLAIAILAAAVGLVSQRANLFERISGDVRALSQPSALERIIDPGRVRLWKAAGKMLAAYPLCGVGVGGFIIEFPNYKIAEDRNPMYTDSAENYFLQAGAELGILGLVLILWLWIAVFRLLRTVWRRIDPEESDVYLQIGFLTGLFAVVINLIFHSYIGAFDVKYLLWMLVGLCAAYSLEDRPSTKYEGYEGFTRIFVAAAVGLVLVYSAILVWHSTHTLSLSHSAETYGWDQNFGLYANEQDEQGMTFNWTRKTAGLSFVNTGQKLILPIRASHPAIERYPVKVTVYRADAFFRRMEKIEDFRIDHTRWMEWSVSLARFSEGTLHFIFEVDRTWRPQELTKSPDPRRLGIALGEARFESP